MKPMWVAEFKVWHAGSAPREATRLFAATIETHYLNVFQRKGREYMTGVMVMHGAQSEQAMEYVMKAYATKTFEQGVRNLKREGNQLFYTAPSIRQFHSTILNANVFFIKPQLIRGGTGYWTVAAWEKKHLMDLFHSIDRLPKTKAIIELLSLKQGNAPVFPSSIRQQLTDKQQEAFELACAEGYYSSPRKISLEELAEKTKLPYTTFKDRLRAAEEKIFPALLG
ncbi:helix-turn-helix domain-containing protein [Candidatus Micrarchaeota archaeon]|nr:helix-turn-helix domain-containing protein [Candidatus Micrarchaeota archaeon]